MSAPPRLRLKANADPAYAVQMLSERIMVGGNITARGVGVRRIETTTNLRNAYLEWAEATELQLQGLTLDADVISAFHTPRYWRIRALHEDPRPFALVDAEVNQQLAWLQSLLDDLNARLRRASSAPGYPTVLDTNVLLHFMPITQIRWPELVQRSAVRLIVPLRVVEELDAKKYARRDDLAARARSLLPQLQRLVGSAGAPGSVGAAATVEVLVEDGARYRPLDADEEILDTCRELRQLGQRAVSLVTADTAMHLRAEAEGIHVIRMPDEYSRRPSAPNRDGAANTPDVPLPARTDRFRRAISHPSCP